MAPEEIYNVVKEMIEDQGEYCERRDVPTGLNDIVGMITCYGEEREFFEETPTREEIAGTYPLFKADYDEFPGGETPYPSLEEWMKE